MRRVFVKLVIGVALCVVAASGAQAEKGSEAGNEKPKRVSEDLSKRVWNAKTYKNSNGTFTGEYYGAWIHYLNKNNVWEDINCEFVKINDGFEMTEAPFYFKAPLYSTGIAEFESNNRWDVFEKKEIKAKPFSSFIRSLDAVEVEGELFDLNENGGLDSVIYRNAFPQWNADLLYYVHYGRAPRLEKLIRFNSPIELAKDLKARFEITYSGDFEIKDKEGEIWDCTEEKILSGTMSVQDATTTEKRGVGLKPPKIWDSGRGEDFKIQLIEYSVKPIENGILLTKILPKEFFDKAVYPVFTDTQATFNPDAHTETTTVDGRAGRKPAGYGTWADCHDGAGNSSSDSETKGNYAAQESSAGFCCGNTADMYIGIMRNFLLFDTSSLPDDATINNTSKLSIYGVIISYGFGSGAGYLSLVRSTPASNTAITNGDYQNIGTTLQADAFATAGMSTSAYSDLVLNATGMASIDKTGITKFGIREEMDRVNSPMWQYYQGSQVDFYSSDNGSNKPKLEVNYTPANQPPAAFSLTAPLTLTSTNNNTPAFSWGISTDPDPGDTVTYTMKLSTTAAFTEPVYRTVSGLSSTSHTPGIGIDDGSYYWKVIASDGVLQTESTQTWQLTVDTQPPSTPQITNFFTNTDGTISRIYGSGENGTTLTFYDKDNNPVTGSTAWDGSGNFTFTPTTPLDPGSSVYVKSEDGALNSSQSRTHVVIVEDYMDIFKDIAVYHGTGPGNSMRLEKDTSYEFDLAVNAGAAVTVKAWLMYNSEYDGSGADAPRITLSGLGITTGNTASMTAPASYTPDIWEELTVSGTPNAKGVVTLKVETFSTVYDAKAWIDDITVSQ